MVDESGVEGDRGELQSTYPLATNISVSGPFADAAAARDFGHHIIGVLHFLGKVMDLSTIDGVTITATYHEALLNLDRGVEGLRPLTASTVKDGVIGVAMAPAVRRDGVLKTHLVFDVNYIWYAADPESEHFVTALHVLAHESAHVEIQAALEKAAPGRRLKAAYSNFIEQFRGEIIDACLEEYAVTRLCARLGTSPLSGYLETFLNALSDTNTRANMSVRAYRLHGDMDLLLEQVPPLYGNLIKWCSYLLGTMHGLGLTIEDIQDLRTVMEGHWFADFFNNLSAEYDALWKRRGEWSAPRDFEIIGDIAERILDEAGGLQLRLAGDIVHVDVPYRSHNTAG